MPSLLTALIQLQIEVNNGTINTPNGICYGICYRVYGEIPSTDWSKLNELIMLWPLCTGDKMYPVPANRANKNYSAAHGAFIANKHSPNQMWLEGEYAELRRALLAWLIATLEEEQAQCNGLHL